MKCPKCSYISFDYNQTCPKCNRDINSEQQKMNHPTYKPSTPFLLGALIGKPDQTEGPLFDEVNSLNMDLEIKESEGAKEPEESVAPTELFDTDLLDEEETGDLEPLSDYELEGDIQEISLESDITSPEETESPSALPDILDEEDGSFLDLDALSLEGPETEEESAVEPTTEQEEELGIDLEDLSLDEIIPLPQDTTKESPLNEAEMVTLVIDKNKKGQDASHGLEDTELELELDLDELEDK